MTFRVADPLDPKSPHRAPGAFGEKSVALRPWYEPPAWLEAEPVPVSLTCGVAEENLANNRLMTHALNARGFHATLHVNPDVHIYTGWRDVLHPHLTRLLARLWA